MFDQIKAAIKNQRESSVEQQTCKYATRNGLYSFKVNFFVKGASDRLFVGKISQQPVFFFIEFKRPQRGVIARLQLEFKEIMNRCGISVYFCKTGKEGADAIDYEITKAIVNARAKRL